MKKYSIKDTNLMTWEEVDELIEILLSKIESHKEKITVVAPLLRTGGIIGGILSIKMRLQTMLPVQFKYSYNPTKINQILAVPDILTSIPEPMNVLLCEGNTSTGRIAINAAKVIKEKYPQAKIFLATLVKVYGCPETLSGIEHVFYARMTDEHFKATAEEKAKLNLREGVTIFPWENAGDEISDMNATS